MIELVAAAMLEDIRCLPKDECLVVASSIASAICSRPWAGRQFRTDFTSAALVTWLASGSVCMTDGWL